MSGYFILAILTLAFVVTFQIAKASEYVSVLKGEEKAFRQNNRINAFLFIVFLVLGLIGAWWCNELFYEKPCWCSQLLLIMERKSTSCFGLRWR